MARRIFGGEAVPKIFQTFNSLLGGIVRKRNATIVGPSKQLVGEFPEVDFERLYQYYHHWDQVKTAVDVMHQKFRGSGIKVKSNNEYFNTLIEKWWDVTNSEKKWSQFIFSLLITGSAIMELQYTPDQRLGNIEQIPMQTIYRLFRDQFGNELKIVQIVDGVFKELDPQFFIHSTINNPDRQAFGKSMFHTLASARPITGTIDPFTKEAVNPSRQSIPLLDAQAELQNAEIEIKKKMAKPRLMVSAIGMPRDQMDTVEAEMADPNTDKYIWIFDKPIQSAELQVQAQGKFDEYGTNVDAHIDVGTIFASNVIKNPQGFSYSGAQSGLDVLDQRMSDLQSELTETIKDRLLKPIAESWGFIDFQAMEVEVSFIPTMKRLTMDDIRGLDPEAISKKEIREMYKALNIPLDDKLWEDEQQELKQDKQDEKNIQMQGALNGLPPDGSDPASGGSPFAPAGGDGDKPKPAGGKSGQAQEPKVPEISEPKTGAKTPFEMDRPKPTPTQTPQPNKKPRGESIISRMIKNIANEGYLSDTEKFRWIKALERIPLPPKAGDQGLSSSDLYVSQGIDDIEDKPDITDPNVRLEFGLDKDESELPPSAPSKMARAGDTPQLNPADNTEGRFTADDDGIPQVPEVSEDEYKKHLAMAGDEIQGGLGNDGIDASSDGTFKDPYDLKGDMEKTPETPNATANQHAGPNQPPLVAGNDDTMKVTGGSDALPDNTNKQILGASDNDEQPIVPSEGFPEDNDEEKKKQLINSQNLGEAVKPTMLEKPFKAQPDPVTDNRDIIEGEDPLTSGVEEPITDEIGKPQARLDDAPLQDPSANKGDINGINPSRDAEMTMQEDTGALANDGVPEEATKFDTPADPEKTDNLGDSGQVRLQREEQTGLPQDQLLPNDSNDILDNTGLNVKPEFAQVQDGSNPLEQEGEPLEDGAIIKPEDIQQHGGIGDTDGLGNTPVTPDGTTAHDQDPNTINDPTDSGIEEEEIDPNVLHQDPETGIKYTDLTDEQGNEVPDLRFDQEPDSDEEQPDVELEYEIVTKEEYDQHLDVSKGQQEDPMSEDAFNAELDSQSMDEEAPNPFENEPSTSPVGDDQLAQATGSDTSKDGEVPLGDSGSTSEAPSESPSEGSSAPKESGGGDKEESSSSDGGNKVAPKGDSEPKEEVLPSSGSDESPSPSKGEKPSSSNMTPNDDKEEPNISDSGATSSKPKEDKSEPKNGKSTTKKSDDKSQDDSDSKDESKRKGTVKDIIKLEHELLDQGVDDDEIRQLLEDEFGEERIDKAEETKTWKNRK